MKLKLSLNLLIVFFIFGYVSAQQISVDADDYKQEFTGTGATAGLYIGHYLSLSETNRLATSRMLYEDLKLNAIKYYSKNRPEDNPDEYDDISIAIANAKIFNPDIEVMMCTNNLPDDLELKIHEHDPNIPNIMDKIAEYYFSVCKGYHDRGHKVDIIELINEKGYISKKTDLYDIAATKFKALINDTTYNTTNVPMPKIAGPATWSAASPKTFINGWIADRPNAWANVDIVTTHGYQQSTEANFAETFSLCEGKPFYQSEQTGKIQTDESPGVDVLGEQFPDPTYYPPFVSNAEIAKQMIDFFNGGGNSFYCFLANTARIAHNAGLVGTPWAGTPGKTQIYDGFKHLSATHPIGARRVSRELSDETNQYGDYRHKVVSFREEGSNVVYVHVLNLYNTNNQFSLDFKGKGIKQVKVIHTDEFLDFEEIENKTYSAPLSAIVLNTTPYSVTTAVVTLEDTSTQILQNQTITFNAIDNVEDNVVDLDLTATASSNLPVSYEVLSGPATVAGAKLSITGIGIVRVRATQVGNSIYYKAAPVEQTFYVRPGGPNIALNRPATASSQFNNTYTPDKAVDGNIIDNANRWLTSNSVADFETSPQWIEIALDANYEINAFSFYTGFNGYNKPIYEFDFQVFNTQTNSWNTVISETDNVNPIYLKAFTPVIGNKVRLYMDGSPNKFIARLYELEVFGEFASVLSTSDKEYSQVQVYPNPVTGGQLHVKGVNNIESLSVCNLLGAQQKIGFKNNIVDVSKLSSGLYFLNINNKLVYKFIKK